MRKRLYAAWYNLNVDKTEIYFIIAVALAIFFWLVKPHDVKRFLKEYWRGFALVIYIIIALGFSAISLFLVVSIAAVEFNLNTVVLVVLMLWALLGIWTPMLQCSQDKGIHSAIGITHIVFGSIAFCFFWIYQWPLVSCGASNGNLSACISLRRD